MIVSITFNNEFNQALVSSNIKGFSIFEGKEYSLCELNILNSGFSQQMFNIIKATKGEKVRLIVEFVDRPDFDILKFNSLIKRPNVNNDRYICDIEYRIVSKWNVQMVSTSTLLPIETLHEVLCGMKFNDFCESIVSATSRKILNG